MMTVALKNVLSTALLISPAATSSSIPQCKTLLHLKIKLHLSWNVACMANFGGRAMFYLATPAIRSSSVV